MTPARGIAASRPVSNSRRHLPKLVMFDLDGVLVATQDAEDGGVRHLAAYMGLTLSATQASELFSGKRIRDCADELARLCGRQAPENYEEIVRSRCRELLGDGSISVHGVAAALTQIDLPMCVVSNSPLRLMESRLEQSKLRQFFSMGLFSAYELGVWKPDSQIYRSAAAICGVPPWRCIVVEDSEAGVRAALGAQMRVLRYRPLGRQSETLTGCLEFVDMSQLPRLLTDT